ncbi:MAG: hypothetical protein KGZ34_03695 [Nitrosarchaeum sp.]|nr:hypothetical protein [Nitrosarchaeum sp.]
MKNSFTGSVSKIKLSQDDFVLVGMNYNYYMIPKLAHSGENLEELKQEILKNQEMSEELKAVWDGADHMFVNNTVKIMERYFGTRR